MNQKLALKVKNHVQVCDLELLLHHLHSMQFITYQKNSMVDVLNSVMSENQNCSTFLQALGMLTELCLNLKGLLAVVELSRTLEQ